MEGATLILVIIVSILIQYVIIYYAVYNSREKERYYLKVQMRLMIKKLKKDGLTKDEIIAAMDAGESDFWAGV